MLQIKKKIDLKSRRRYISNTMTVFDASIKLYAWFSENDSFCFDTDEEKLLKSDKRKKQGRREQASAINCALKDLESLNLIAYSTVEDKDVWILKKSFDSMTQNIELSAETCLSMSQIINGFCEMLGNDKDLADPTSITEVDIKNLVYCCAYLMDNKNKGEDSGQ